MKKLNLAFPLTLVLALAMAGAGCKQRPKNMTPIPGSKPPVEGPGRAPFVTQGPATSPGQGATLPTSQNPQAVDVTPPAVGPEGQIEHTGLDQFEGRPANREVFRDFTVYFDYDRSEVRASERNKIESVATQIKNGPAGQDLLIEGHCDERGTEEYNRALGERRALAVREYLVNLGIAASRIRTISYGEDRPASAGHDDAAWSMNRRGEFVLLLPRE